MDENCSYSQFEDSISDELKATIVKISKAAPSDQVVKPDLEDEQKRWLIIGICLHSILSPALRRYIQPVLNKFYNSLKQTYNIHCQQYPNHLKQYPPTNRELNYENINNNKSIPLAKRRKDVQNYNYDVSSIVDLSKLFLMTNMAHYTGFNDTCDSSALLGIIINIDQFPQAVRYVAEKVRSNIRNPWAHCNFTEWDATNYLSSFQQMKQFIINMQLGITEEAKVLGDMSKWELNGIHFLHGHSLSFELASELCRQTSVLAEYSLQTSRETEYNLKTVHEQCRAIQNEFNKVIDSIKELTTSQILNSEAIGHVQHEVAQLKHETDIFSQKQSIQKSEIKKIENKMTEIEKAQIMTHEKVTSLETSHTTTKYDIVELMKNYEELRSDIYNVRNTGIRRTEGRLFFHPPIRIEYFIGRNNELEQLANQFANLSNEQYSQALSGLGGCGKTSLAIEFSWLFEHFYPGGVFWISAYSEEDLENSISKLAFYINTNGDTFKQTLFQTLKWLALLQERWLLVVDNVDGIEIKGHLKDVFLGTWKYNSNGHILVTSRRNPIELEESLKINSNDCITLNMLTPEEGLHFMKLRTGRNIINETEHMNKLVHELGGLPLALEQAGAYIKVLRCSFAEYIERFQKQRLKLFLRAADPAHSTDNDRLNIRTTWKLNFDYICAQSEIEGLGSTAGKIMEVASFLYADEIPFEVFNAGCPEIDDDDLKNNLSDDLGAKQVICILTRFSLFQENSCNSNNLKVHRLVQEVIREQLNEVDHLEFILLSATRMIHKALKSTKCPTDVIKSSPGDRKLGSLVLWNILAINANILKQHIFTYLESKQGKHTLWFNLEICKLLQATAIHHSIYQRQSIALQDQDQMLQVIATIDLPVISYDDLTCIKIPVFEKERSILQNCMSETLILANTKEGTTLGTENKNCDPDSLRLAGNNAFKLNKYHDATKYYSDAIKVSRSSDYRLYSNRSLMYLKIQDYENALKDADACILANPGFWKGYCWKAYAIANLIRIGVLDKTMETVGLASACIAAFLNENCLLEFRMKMDYPIIVYQIVSSNNDLYMGISSLIDRPYTTFILQKGYYLIKDPVPTFKSVQIIGIEEGVEICFTTVLNIHLLSSDVLPVKIKREEIICFHFENLVFVTGCEGISVGSKAIATFYQCKFSNGKKGCKAFPRCVGGKGCVSQDCKRTADICEITHNDMWMEPVKNGVPGFPGLQVNSGGKAFVDNCNFDRCGGGGVLSADDGSILDVKNSTFQNMNQCGIEAREGGCVKAFKNTITDNKGHGVLIGPKGVGVIKFNLIQNNANEGILCCAMKKADLSVDFEKGSKTHVCDNIICQNGLSGISLDCGTFNVCRNKIFENWLWGMMIKSRSATYVLQNELFENKCGGIRVGVNYSASVIIDGNTIRDHSGPGIYVESSSKSRSSENPNIPLAGEIMYYTLPPMITDRNVFRNNDKGLQHPKEIVKRIRSCCFCHTPVQSSKQCANCKKASYCSKECQRKHWQRHKHTCELLQESYIVEIKMETTKPFRPPGTKKVFDSSLKGILEGKPPNPKSIKRFIVKIQSGKEYTPYDPNKSIVLYDQTVTLDILFSNPKLFHLVNECGILSTSKLTTKKMFCWASFKDNGNILCIYTDNLPPFQTW